jgi:hypothetical protein
MSKSGGRKLLISYSSSVGKMPRQDFWPRADWAHDVTWF